MKCLVCGKEMTNLGNVLGIVMDSLPQQWDDVYVCNICKTKKVVRKYDDEVEESED